MSAETFERKRLALFARYGFNGQSRWYADRRGRRTCAIARGDGDCPTLLLHGGLSQAGEWALLAGRIPGHVIVADRPGCGLSYPIDYRGMDYRREAAAWLRELLEGIGAERVNLVGNSMGGFFAMAFATACPDRVRRLVLVGAPAGIDRWIPPVLRLWGNPVIGPLIVALKLTNPATPEALRERVFAPLLVAHAERIPRELLELFIAAAALPGAGRTSYSILRSALTLRGWRPRLMLRDDMARCPVPTLFLWGGPGCVRAARERRGARGADAGCECRDPPGCRALAAPGSARGGGRRDQALPRVRCRRREAEPGGHGARIFPALTGGAAITRSRRHQGRFPAARTARCRPRSG